MRVGTRIMLSFVCAEEIIGIIASARRTSRYTPRLLVSVRLDKNSEFNLLHNPGSVLSPAFLRVELRFAPLMRALIKVRFREA